MRKKNPDTLLKNQYYILRSIQKLKRISSFEKVKKLKKIYNFNFTASTLTMS